MARSEYVLQCAIGVHMLSLTNITLYSRTPVPVGTSRKHFANSGLVWTPAGHNSDVLHVFYDRTVSVQKLFDHTSKVLWMCFECFLHNFTHNGV